MLREPHDTMRLGLSSLKEDVSTSHPVEAIQKQHAQQHGSGQDAALRNTYGGAFPARMALDRQILTRVQRLPGLPSSHLGLESLTGDLDDFSFGSYLGTMAEAEAGKPDMHSIMEQKLKMGTKPVSRRI